MYEILTSYVIPKWMAYLTNKNQKVSHHSAYGIRTDAVWKRLIRDTREFYRILFRIRFHYLDFKDISGARKWVELLFSELGIPITQENIKDTVLFKFIHQSHKTTTSRIFKKQLPSIFSIVEEFNMNNCREFMEDPLGSKMFFFVFYNFSGVFSEMVDVRYKHQWQKELQKWLCDIA